MTLDVMIVWSSQTQAAAGAGMPAFAQQCADITNSVYANSGITARLRLVHAGPCGYSESGNYNTDLMWLAGDQGIAALRTAHGADLVSLIIENGQYCGMGMVGPASGRMFNVVNRGCAVGNYSFVHELGHNMGARHDPANDPALTPYAYGHGYNRGADRDVMAYPPGTRLPYLANPRILVNGAPMGNAETSDVARVINQNAELIASYRAGLQPPTPPVTMTRIKGINLTSKPGHPLESAYWIEWDWDGWIRPQLDVAAALGCNAVRIIGDVAMVLNGQITQAVYNARWQQFAAYCQQRGLGVYYTGCATYDTNGGDNGSIAAYNANPSGFAAVIVSNLQALDDYPLIGGDLVQEANAWGNAAACNALYAAVRPQVSATVPLTFSTYGVMPHNAWLDQIIGACDFIDYHVYPHVYGAVDPLAVYAAARAAFPSKAILFGEGGAKSVPGNAEQVEAWINKLVALGSLQDTMGAMVWAAQDQDEPYGAVDANWHPRAAVFGPWMKWCRLDYLSQPVPPATEATVPPLASVIGPDGAEWTLGAVAPYGKWVLRNGSGPAAFGGQGDIISYKNGQIKVHNTLGNWYLWTGVAPGGYVLTGAP
jgi:hypothetical protein